MKILEDSYKKLAEDEGRVVIAASKPNQFSYEDLDLKHGIFTHHLLDALAGKSDSGDGYVRVQSVYKYLRDKVPKSAKKTSTIE